MRAIIPTLIVLTGSLLLAGTALAAAEEPAVASAEPPTQEEVAELIQQGQRYLLAQQQEDGSFLPIDQHKLGITLLVVDALVGGAAGLDAEHPAIAKALAYTEQFVRDDGGVYSPDDGLANYTTSIALMVWSQLGTASPERIQAAQEFILGLQNSDADSPMYGGIRYAGEGPKSEDLSNTGYALEALHKSGKSNDDPRMQAALKFLERCQNLSEVNDQPWAGSDGGAVYAPDESKAGGSWTSEEEQARAAAEAQRTGRMNSYGSMTYQLIKSYIYLDLPPDDPRVRAAYEWVLNNYRFDANPGMPEGKEQQGRFFYLLNMSKTFNLLDKTSLELPDGRTVDWRGDLFRAIAAEAQQADLEGGEQGAFWINGASRWDEGLPQLCNAYMIKALKRIHASLEAPAAE